MANTENKNSKNSNPGGLITDYDHNMRQPDIILPGEIPAIILPIIDNSIKNFEEQKKENPDKDNLNAGINEADEMDNSGAAGE
jgi:hypothetical protein